MSAHVSEITMDQFDAEVLGANTPVVLDFFSTDCPPCEALAPKFEAVAEQFAGQVKFVKVHRQASRELAVRLNVTGSPTLVFFKGGKELGERLAGDIQRSAIKRAVEALVS
ncbi:MAG: thioredoxin family protein [Myxococcota bacterium]